MTFSHAARRHLDYYVYALVDPRDASIFYVGKAHGNNRAFKHLKVRSGESEKQQRIQMIRTAGEEPRVEILRHGLPSEQAALDVEAAIIDSLGIENLKNQVRGHHIQRGRQTAEEIEQLHGSEPVDIDTLTHPYMLFFIHQTYSPTKSEAELYDSVRQFWYGVARATRVPSEGTLPYTTALGVVDSVVVRAYTIEAWFPAGSTFSSRTPQNSENRWEFVGQRLPDHPLIHRMLHEDGAPLPANQQGYGYIG